MENGDGDQDEAKYRTPHAEGRAHGQGGDLFGSEAPAEADVSGERYDPGENQAGECGSHDVEEGLFRGPVSMTSAVTIP